MRRLEVGVAGAQWNTGSGVSINKLERSGVPKVRPGDAYSIRSAQNCIGTEPVLGLHAGKDIDVTVVRSQRRSSDKISAGRIEIELVRAQRIRSGFHSYSSLKAQTSKTDRIHGIACPDSLGDIEVILQVVNNVRCRASPLNGGKNLRVLRNRPVGEVTEIVVVISIGA